MRREYKRGMSAAEIGKMVGISTSSTFGILNGTTWKRADALEPPVPKDRLSRHGKGVPRGGKGKQPQKQKKLLYGPNRPRGWNKRTLTSAQVKEIRRRRAAGEKLTSIAEDFGINFTTVSKIALRHTYKDVD